MGERCLLIVKVACHYKDREHLLVISSAPSVMPGSIFNHDKEDLIVFFEGAVKLDVFSVFLITSPANDCVPPPVTVITQSTK